MLEVSEIDIVGFVLASVFTGVSNDALLGLKIDSSFLSDAESEKSTIFFLSQHYYFVS